MANRKSFIGTFISDGNGGGWIELNEKDAGEMHVRAGEELRMASPVASPQIH